MDHQQLLARSMEALATKTAAHDRIWHLKKCDWSVDQFEGTIVFSAPNGMLVTCAVQIIGTFDSNDSSWLWAWDHPSVQAELTKHANRVREYGEKNSIAELITRKLSVTEEQCWEFTALATELNDAQGAYRGPAGDTFVFMTFGTPNIKKDPDAESVQLTAKEDDSCESQSEIPADVKQTLIQFITALHDWEKTAFQEEMDKVENARDRAQASRNELISKWCVPEIVVQKMAFGMPAKHNPEKEELVSAARFDNKCRVQTKETDDFGFISDYEYHLRFENGRWLVEQYYFVDGDSKYEML